MVGIGRWPESADADAARHLTHETLDRTDTVTPYYHGKAHVKPRGLVPVVLVAVIVSSADTLHGECVGFPLEQYVKYADLVFVGTLTHVEPARGSKGFVTFDVSRVWKGAVPRRMVLYQARWNIDSVEFSAETVGTSDLPKDARGFARRLGPGREPKPGPQSAR